MIVKEKAYATQSTEYKQAHKCNASDAFYAPWTMLLNYDTKEWKYEKFTKQSEWKANETRLSLPTEPPAFRLPLGCTGFPDRIFNAWSLPRIIKLTGCDQLFSRRRARDLGNTDSRHSFFCTPSAESSMSEREFDFFNDWVMYATKRFSGNQLSQPSR